MTGYYLGRMGSRGRIFIKEETVPAFLVRLDESPLEITVRKIKEQFSLHKLKEVNMHLTVTARHFKLTDDLNSFIEKEVPIFKRHYDGILDVEVILGWEKKDRICEINVNIEGRTLTASDRSEDMKKSIRLCVEKMDRQLRKQNRRQHESTHKPAGENKTAV